MKRAKRILTSLLACLMVVGLLPVTAMAKVEKKHDVTVSPVTITADGSSHALVEITNKLKKDESLPAMQYLVSSEELTEWPAEEDWVDEIPEEEEVGTYYIYFQTEGNDNFNAIAKDLKNHVVSKIEKAKANIVVEKAETIEEGEPLVVVTEGPEEGIKFLYSESQKKKNELSKSEDWSEDIPDSQGNVKCYVYYYYDGDDDYLATGTQANKYVEIEFKKDIVVTPVEKLTERPSEQQLVILADGPKDAKQNEKVKYYVSDDDETDPSTIEDKDWLDSSSKVTAQEAGTYYVYYYYAKGGPAPKLAEKKIEDEKKVEEKQPATEDDFNEIAKEDAKCVTVVIGEATEDVDPDYIRDQFLSPVTEFAYTGEAYNLDDVINVGIPGDTETTKYVYKVNGKEKDPYKEAKDITLKDANDYTINWKKQVLIDKKWTDVEDANGTLEIKIEKEEFKLVLKEDLKYNKKSQSLVDLEKTSDVDKKQDEGKIFFYVSTKLLTEKELAAIKDEKWVKVQNIEDVKAKEAGTYYVYYHIHKDSTYQEVAHEKAKYEVVTISVEKAKNCYITRPTGRTIIADGEYHKLVVPGCAKYGNIKYAVTTEDVKPDDDAFSYEIPKARTHGFYFIWYKVDETEYYEGLPIEGSILTEIKAKYILPEGEDDLTYNGNYQKLLSHEGHLNLLYDDSWIMQYKIATKDGDDFGDSWHSYYKHIIAKDAGEYIIQVSAVKLDCKGRVIEESRDLFDENVVVTIKQKKVEVVVSAEKVYGTEDPKYTQYTFETKGMCNGERFHIRDIDTFTREEGEDVLYTEKGEYDFYKATVTIKEKSEAKYANYDITFKGGLTITPYDLSEQGNKVKVTLSGFVAAYDGKTKTQNIQEEITVTSAAGIKYTLKAGDYTVSGNQAIQNGLYSISIEGKGNYMNVAKDVKTWVILKDDEDLNNPAFKGTVEVFEVNDDKVPFTGWALSDSEVLKALSLAEEVSRAADGEELKVWLDVKMADVDAETKAAIAKTAGDRKICEYLDITIWSKIGRDDEIQIHNPIHPVSISIELTEEQISKDPLAKRTYSLVQTHEGENALLDVVYDKDDETVTFSADKFSVYTLVYAETITPKTADNNNTWLFVVMATLALASMVYFGMTMKKREEK